MTDNFFLTLGLTSATASLTLKRSEATGGTSLRPKGALGDMLVEVLAILALVMILTLMIYARGLVAPLAAALIAAAVFFALRHRPLTRFHRFQLPLAVTAFLAAIGYWLTEF